MIHLSECKICMGWLAHCMVEPLRCPGLSYDKQGRFVTASGKLWSEIVDEVRAENDEARKKYWQEHREHLAAHGQEHPCEKR